MSEYREVKVSVEIDGIPVDNVKFTVEPWVTTIDVVGKGKFTSLDEEESTSCEGARIDIGELVV